MNRAEKRRLERSEAWFNSLSDDKKEIIDNMINEKVSVNNDLMSAISDTCTVGALDDVLNIDISKISDVLSKTKEYMIDYGEYLEKEKNGGIKMIENEELRNRVKTKIEMYMLGKMDKARGLKLLKSEFNLPFAELSDLWIECKADKGGYSKNKNVGVNIEDKKLEITTKPGKIETKDEKITVPEKKINLKVIKVTTEIEGEYGTYIRNNDGVKIDGKLYSDIDAVKKEKIVSASQYKVKIDNIKDKINELNKELKQIQDLGLKELDKFIELESVFSL